MYTNCQFSLFLKYNKNIIYKCHIDKFIKKYFVNYLIYRSQNDFILDFLEKHLYFGLIAK